jgi:hypothetical protein
MTERDVLIDVTVVMRALDDAEPSAEAKASLTRLVTMALVDLHRIADAAEAIAEHLSIPRIGAGLQVLTNVTPTASVGGGGGQPEPA